MKRINPYFILSIGVAAGAGIGLVLGSIAIGAGIGTVIGASLMGIAGKKSRHS